MTKRDFIGADTTLMDLFKMGQTGGFLEGRPSAWFKGPFTCAFAGEVFKNNNLRAPMAIMADDNGICTYLDRHNVRTALFIIQDRLMVVPLDGPNKGERMLFERNPAQQVSGTEIFRPSPFADNDKTTVVVLTG